MPCASQPGTPHTHSFQTHTLHAHQAPPPPYPPLLPFHSQRAIAALPTSTLTLEDLDALLHDECLVCYELMHAGNVGRGMPCAANPAHHTHIHAKHLHYMHTKRASPAFSSFPTFSEGHCCTAHEHAHLRGPRCPPTRRVPSLL